MRHLPRIAALLLIIGLLTPPAWATGAVPAGFADLAEKLSPAVVNISTTQTIRNPERGSEIPQFPPGSPFEDFFKDFMDKQMKQDQTPRKATSLGSGFIVDAAGYVVTNNHVIQDAEDVTVTLADGTVFKAEIKGRDTKTDLALLKIDPGKKALATVAFGNSDKARVGDWVLAIGNPFGLGGTVTAGIVSARARDINSGPYDDFIQTDASINRGNSGGPLFNMDGEVIGINTAIFSPSSSGGSIGIGFSIPSSLAAPVIDDLRKFGKTRRGWLGLHIQSIDQELVDTIGLPDDKGALVAKINEGSPAAKAGVKPGDVVLKFDGKDITKMRSLPRIVAETPIGKQVDMDVWRNGKIVTLKVTVGELKEQPQDEAKDEERPQPSSASGQTIGSVGLMVSAVTPALKERFGLDDQTAGLVVIEVKNGSSAAERGMKPGDVIIEAGQQTMHTPKDLVEAISAAKSAGQKSLLLRVENPQAIRYVALPLDGKGRK